VLDPCTVGTARARIRWARLAAPARRAVLGFCQTRAQLCCIPRSLYRLASSPSLVLAPWIACSRRLRSRARAHMRRTRPRAEQCGQSLCHWTVHSAVSGAGQIPPRRDAKECFSSRPQSGGNAGDDPIVTVQGQRGATAKRRATGRCTRDAFRYSPRPVYAA
jgi:hypothetical protein